MEQKAQDSEISVAMVKIAIFKGRKIRKVIYKNEWWFSVADVVKALTDSANVKQYIKRMRQRDHEISYWGTICIPVVNCPRILDS